MTVMHSWHFAQLGLFLICCAKDQSESPVLASIHVNTKKQGNFGKGRPVDSQLLLRTIVFKGDETFSFRGW